jgi:hypothetical protein
MDFFWQEIAILRWYRIFPSKKGHVESRSAFISKPVLLQKLLETQYRYTALFFRDSLIDGVEWLQI